MRFETENKRHLLAFHTKLINSFLKRLLCNFSIFSQAFFLIIKNILSMNSHRD